MRFIGIDPSTATGLVELDGLGNVIRKEEVILDTGMFSTAAQIKDYGKKIVDSLPSDCLVCIEGFSFGSKGQGVSTQYGVGFAIRFALIERGMVWVESPPSQVKKFATGKGNASKESMILPLYKHWNFEHDSDNVRDAFVLAQMALSIRMGTASTKYQEEVIQAILGGPKSKKKTKAV